MSSNIVSEDLRSIKTEKALYAAIFSLLKRFNFKKITVKGICEEAIISRAAFYAHFIDKYDLLKYWIRELWLKNFNGDYTYEQIEKAVNERIYENTRILKNLIYDADNETLELLFDFILSTKNMKIKQTGSGNVNCKDAVVSNFYAGGIISYLLWQVKNNFPPNIPLMNKEIYQMIVSFETGS